MAPIRLETGLQAWEGRVDAAEGELALRWHQVVHALPKEPARGAAIVGFACDEGVRRNQGRPGAAEAPEALRRALSNLPVRRCRDLFDAGTIRLEGEDLEGAQAAYARRITEVLNLGLLPLGLGGGHEIAWGAFLGLAEHLAERELKPRIGILNLDAHFDLRVSEEATSGTPFRQIAEECFRRDWGFHYCVLGISPFANTEALFERARTWGVRFRLDEEMTAADLPAALADVEAFLASVDHVYLTCCLDVLPAASAPGVSAPAARGVALEILERVVDVACASGKVRMADVAELNPLLDEDGRTAKVGARLLGRIAERTAPESLP
ncbi:MAG TPA: formimidoylglutamase [Holophagaceae bacterium]|nr:formimidoylglutamase [Holophagaceae bacterium]